jgi:hypothetical protein
VASKVLQRALAFDVLACVYIVRGLSDRALSRSEEAKAEAKAAAAACGGVCEVCSKGGVSSSSFFSSNSCACGHDPLLYVTDPDEFPARSKLAVLPTEVSGAFALVFLDHDKESYKPDLNTVMRLGGG